MAGKTVTRADLCEALYRQCKLSHAQAKKLVESVLNEIKDFFEQGETVKLSSFGSFFVRKKGQRMGCNPKTGEPAVVSARRVLVFKPSDILIHRINAPARPSSDAD